MLGIRFLTHFSTPVYLLKFMSPTKFIWNPYDLVGSKYKF